MRGGRRPNAGRKSGTPNKISAQLKDMILGALDTAGGQSYLVRCAKENPAAFMTLLGKVLPTQVTGKDGKDFLPAMPPTILIPVDPAEAMKVYLELMG